MNLELTGKTGAEIRRKQYKKKKQYRRSENRRTGSEEFRKGDLMSVDRDHLCLVAVLFRVLIVTSIAMKIFGSLNEI